MNQKRIQASAVPRSHRLIWLLLGPFIIALFGGCRPKLDEPKIEFPNKIAVEVPHQDSMVMAWGGESHPFGYLRAELWTGQTAGQAPTQELVINYFDGKVRRHAGFLIDLPLDFQPRPGQWRAFISFPIEISGNQVEPGKILAVFSPAGGLRLYVFARSIDEGAPELQPIR